MIKFPKNFDTRPISDAEEDWHIVCQNSQYLPVVYQLDLIKYSRLFYSEKYNKIIDFSTVFYSNSKPIAIWPACVSRDGLNFKISSYENSILPPLFTKHANKKQRITTIRKVLSLVGEIKENYGIEKSLTTDCFSGSPFISEWIKEAVPDTKSRRALFDLVLDLTPEVNEIKRCFRDSYKSLINKGNKLWRIETIVDPVEEDFWEFRRLHFSVSGRATRSEETWFQQLSAIRNGNMFLVTARNENRMVGGALFSTSKDEARYDVGAYDRTLFHLPIGHPIQSAAIVEMKRRQCMWYKLGQKTCVDQLAPTAEKILNIEKFKAGFASSEAIVSGGEI